MGFKILRPLSQSLRILLSHVKCKGLRPLEKVSVSLLHRHGDCDSRSLPGLAQTVATAREVMNPEFPWVPRFAKLPFTPKYLLRRHRKTAQ